MLKSAGNVIAFLVAIGLVGAPIWTVHALWRRRCVAAATRAAAELDGRYEKGGHLSGGRIFGRPAGRDVVIDFFTGSSQKRAQTTAMTTVAQSRSDRLRVRRKLLGGWDGVEGLPPAGTELVRRLESFWWPELEAWSNMLSVRVNGVLHDAARIVELASIVAALASELERSAGRPSAGRPW
jgi:hypothetical protein